MLPNLFEVSKDYSIVSVSRCVLSWLGQIILE